MQACWRNLYWNWTRLDPFTMDPLAYALPNNGLLTLDYISFDVPVLKGADFLAQLASPRSKLFRKKPLPKVAHMIESAPSIGKDRIFKSFRGSRAQALRSAVSSVPEGENQWF